MADHMRHDIKAVITGIRDQQACGGAIPLYTDNHTNALEMARQLEINVLPLMSKRCGHELKADGLHTYNGIYYMAILRKHSNCHQHNHQLHSV